MTEAAWRRRYRAARVTLPDWARDAPDRLLYASNAGGKWELYAWDRRADTRRQVTDRPEGTLSGTLDPSGAQVWWFDDERGNEKGRWVREAFTGGKRATVAPELPAAYSAGLALARGFAVIGTSDDDGATIRVVAPGAEPRAIYHHRQQADVAGLSRDETRLCISHSEHGDSRHPALRVVDLRGDVLADLSDAPGRGLWALEWSPIPGDQRLLVQHEREAMGRPLIWDTAGDGATELHFDLPGEVEASWYPDARALLVAHDHRGRGGLYRYDLAGGELERIPTEPGTIGAARVRPDGAVWYAWTRSSAPPEIRSDSGRVVLRAPGEPAPGGVAYSDHAVGDVHVFLAEPSGPRPHPTIVDVHGGPHAHSRDSFSPRVQAWVDHGYAVALVNYRGSTGYGHAWRDALEGNPGLTELEDLAHVHDWLIAAGIADPARIILAGASWGGYLTLLGLGMQPERWSLGLAGVPVADYVAAFEDEMEPLKAFDRALFGGAPDEIPEAYRRRSPLTYAERVRVPLLLLAGENDPRCPIRQIDNYLARLRELDKPHAVYRYDAGHGSLVVDESLRQVERELAFAAEHLGTRPPQ